MPARLTRAGCALAVALAAFGTSAAVHAAASPDDVAAGKKIVFAMKGGNCVACHNLPGASMAGNVGPQLGPWVKKVFHTKEDLVHFLYDPQAKIPHIVMPEFGKNGMLTQKELEQVAEYLWSLNDKGERP